MEVDKCNFDGKKKKKEKKDEQQGGGGGGSRINYRRGINVDSFKCGTQAANCRRDDGNLPVANALTRSVRRKTNCGVNSRVAHKSGISS